MSRVLGVALSVSVAGTAFLVTDAQAATIRVSQESVAGLGDFDANILGFVTTYDTALAVSGLYMYNNPGAASYNGQLNGGPLTVADLSQAFILNSSTDGLSLVVVHDAIGNSDGGTAATQWNLTGDLAGFRLFDDAGETYINTGGTQFNITQAWAPCCTDGYAIGSLDGNWTLYGQFLTFPTGLSAWRISSADGGHLGLTLLPGRRVRLDVVPEPATLLLLGTGLAAAGVRRRMKKRG